jgi:hypothetical protein
MNTFHSHLLRFNLTAHFAILLLALAAAVPGFCAPIDDAARAGDLAQVKLLIAAHPELVSSTDEKFGQTPLHIASFNGHKDVVEFLLASKADVNAKSKNGSTPLHLAAARGNKEIVEVLLANKAEIDAVDNEGWSPLHSAIYWSQKETADLLTAKGAKELPAPKKPPVVTPPTKTQPKETGKDGALTLFDDGTILDTRTKLMWMSRDNSVGLSWPDVKKYVQDYHGANYTDWRLPTPAELAALYDKAKTHRTFCAAAVDELGAVADDVHLPDAFHLSGVRVWSSQAVGEKATLFDFHAGSKATRPQAKEFVDTASRVLMVRDVK